MNIPARHVSLTRQLVVPVVGLVLAAVLANVGFSAWLAARRSAETARAAQEQVADALKAARVSLSAAVLDALHRLTGNHFIVWNESARSLGLSTLPQEAVQSIDSDTVTAAMREGSGLFGGQRYRCGEVRSEGVRPETVLVLTPERSVMATTLEAVWPVIAVAAATLAVLVPLGLRTTGRLATRIAAVERHVARIAEGEFGHTLTTAGHGHPAVSDEISRLIDGVNRMSVQLGTLRTSLIAGERQRLLGQLAAGFAHELRNAITGARLAIDLHRRPRLGCNLGMQTTHLGTSGKSIRFAHHLVDSQSGGVYATVEIVGVMLDLVAHRSIEVPPDIRARLEAMVPPAS